MSWSLPRLYLSPQRTSRSRELSVRRPDFCTATFKRWRLSMSAALQARHRGGVATVAGVEISRHTPEGGDAHAGEAMDFTIGRVALQILDHRPAIGHGLQLRRRAQVAEELAAFLHRAQRQDCGIQGALGELFLALADIAVQFHPGRTTGVIMC